MPRLKLFPNKVVPGTDIDLNNTNLNYAPEHTHIQNWKQDQLLEKQHQDVTTTSTQPNTHSHNHCGDGLFKLWMIFTATVYGLLFLLSLGSLVFTLIYDYWLDIEFQTDNERDFFQLAMVGFTALFAWVLASMYVAYQVDHDGWAFLCSLPSLGIIALAVVVLFT